MDARDGWQRVREHQLYRRRQRQNSPGHRGLYGKDSVFKTLSNRGPIGSLLCTSDSNSGNRRRRCRTVHHSKSACVAHCVAAIASPECYPDIAQVLEMGQTQSRQEPPTASSGSSRLDVDQPRLSFTLDSIGCRRSGAGNGGAVAANGNERSRPERRKSPCYPASEDISQGKACDRCHDTIRHFSCPERFFEIQSRRL